MPMTHNSGDRDSAVAAMEFRRAQLDGGLTVIAEMSGQDWCQAAGVFVRAGSRDEGPETCGACHFLEHMVFRGAGDHRAADVAREFASMRSRYTAFTAEEYTAYYAVAAPREQSSLLRLWAELMNPALREEDVEEEKGAVLEELDVREEQPAMLAAEMAKRLYFEGCGYGRSVLGTRETIARLDAAALREHHRQWYVPHNMIVACAGGGDWEGLLREAGGFVAGAPDAETPARKPVRSRNDSAMRFVADERLPREHICMVTGAPSAQSATGYAACVLGDILGGGRASRLHAALVDCDLADCAEVKYEALDGVGAFYAYIRCSPRYVDRVLHIARECFDRVRSEGVTDGEVERSARKLAMTIRRNCEVPANRIVPVALGWMYRGGYTAPSDEIAILRGISRDDIARLLGEWRLDPVVTVALGPYANPASRG